MLYTRYVDENGKSRHTRLTYDVPDHKGNYTYVHNLAKETFELENAAPPAPAAAWAAARAQRSRASRGSGGQ